MTSESAHTQPPKEYVEQVKQALERLYDLPFLQTFPLAQQVAAARQRSGETAGHQLRRELMLAIEALSPEPGTAVHTPDARLYNLLQLHYVEGLTVQDVSQRLGLSTRQTHRSLRRAEEGVAAILWARFQQQSASSARQLSSVQAEIEQMETTLQPVNLAALLQEAARAVAPLAQSRGVSFQIELPPRPMIVSADTAVSRQLFVSIFSRLSQASRPGAVAVTLHAQPERVLLRLAYEQETAVDMNPALQQAVAPLADRQGWTLELEKTAVAQTVTLRIPLHGPLVLVIDDNEGLVELLERYLAGNNYRVISAGSGQEGLELTRQAAPDAIILDAMMPGMSGWEVLQTLRARPETADTPVIICSVFDDPELAYALGATLFVSKPVSRDDILNALRDLKIV